VLKHIVCYSGGHSSGLVAVEVSRKFGPENTILLNHDINASVEDADIKRFKRDLAAYLGIPITYANMPGFEALDQFDVAIKEMGFKGGIQGQVVCTSRLKTRPFQAYLKANFPPGENCIIYYGYDVSEKIRIQRRSSILAEMGYRTAFPLAHWLPEERTIFSTLEISIPLPNTYSVFKHANCQGCIKGGKQHWYVVYCVRPDLFTKAKMAEDIIGHGIISEGVYLTDLEPEFSKMKLAGVYPTEHLHQATFWSGARKAVKSLNIAIEEADIRPCECVF